MKLTNKHRIDLAPVVWLLEDDYDYNDDPLVISATSLIQPLRPLVLSAQLAADNQKAENTMDVIDIMGSRMGSALHDSLEKAWLNIDKVRGALTKLGYNQEVIDAIRVNPMGEERDEENIIPIYVENRSSRKIGKWTLSGKYDLVVEGQVEDYKSGSVWGYVYGSNTENYIIQGSLYRWLNPGIITGGKVKIHYLFTDWSKSQAVQNPKGYPATRVLSEEYQLWSLEKTEQWIKDKLYAIEQLLPKAQVELPLCTSEELWQKDSVWKYYKNPLNKKRATKNHTSAGSAQTQLENDGFVGEVVYVPGEVVRCKWCSVCPKCDQAAGFIKSGLLTID